MKYILGVVLLLIGLGGNVAAWRGLIRQHHMNSTFVPVDAVITEAHIATHSGSKGSVSYSPEVSYRYMYRQGAFSGDQIFAISQTGDLRWASGVLARLGVGQAQPGTRGVLAKTTAYVNPEDPTQAILLPDYFLGNYTAATLFLLIGEVGLGLLIGVFGNWRTAMVAVPLDDSGWQLLLPTENLRRKFNHSVWWLAGLLVALGVPPLHWMLIARQSGNYPLISGCIVGAALLGMGAWVLARWSVTRHMSDARLRVNPVPMRRGVPLAVELEADAYKPLKVAGITADLICSEHYKSSSGGKTQYGTNQWCRHTVKLAGPANIAAGQAVQGSGAFLCPPADGPATSDLSHGKNYPYFTWEVRVHVDLEGIMDYRARFPLRVE